MKKPNLEKDYLSLRSDEAAIHYRVDLEEYCNFLETALRRQVERTDYWCTKATETRALYSEQVKECARLRRER